MADRNTMKLDKRIVIASRSSQILISKYVKVRDKCGTSCVRKPVNMVG